MCPAFAEVNIDAHAIAEQLPEHGVPAGFVECAQHMPEVEHIKTTIVSRRAMFSTGLDDGGAVLEGEYEGAEDDTEDDAAGTRRVPQGAAETSFDSDASQLAANSGCDAAQRTTGEPGALEANAHETVIGLDPEAHGDFE